MTKYAVRIECSDGIVRDGYQIIHPDGTVVLRTVKGADPKQFGPPKERQTWSQVKQDHSGHIDEVRLSFQRDIYGKDGLDRLNIK